jgi:acetyl-CoA carboxylase biotin carboxylase subunit
MYKRILVANRGEIALRIIRACRELGIETVAVFSEADRGAHYLDLADEAYCIGPAQAAQSYLNINRIISAAEIGNVQAIHPGYGFLAENEHFAEVCRTCNIEFIGPPHEAMAKLGDKVTAKEIARQARVSLVPGSDGLITSEAQALEVAARIG